MSKQLLNKMHRFDGVEDDRGVRARSACHSRRSRRSRRSRGRSCHLFGHTDGAASPTMMSSIDGESLLPVESVQDMLSACLPVRMPAHVTVTELTVALFPMINAHLTQRDVHHPLQLQQALLRHANSLASEDESPIYLLPQRQPSPVGVDPAADVGVDPATAASAPATLNPSEEQTSIDHSDSDAIPWPTAYMPPVRAHLRLLSVPELDRLLHFYQLPVQGTLVERQTQLSLFL